MKKILITALILLEGFYSFADDNRTVINLNGTWDFDQTINAFPPQLFTRKIQVPGLIHLASPVIDEYEKFFKRPDKTISAEQFNLFNLDYTPRYSWYRKRVFVAAEMQGKMAVITLKKSQYVTQVYINGMDVGSSVACYTPVEFPVTNALKFGEENEILIRVGDRVWLPSEAAGGTDKEKEHYLPGIWDDVLLSFTGDFRIDRLLLLPSVKDGSVTIKSQIRSFRPAQIFYGDKMFDSVGVEITVSEKTTGKSIASTSRKILVKRDNLTGFFISIPLDNINVWTPENPYLYSVSVRLNAGNRISDGISKDFGMRDFTKSGKYFFMNGQKYILRGTNITLQRFFEDPDCGNLVWDREWVKKMLIGIPKKLNWNAMRICVGIVPDFWYDLADEYGIVFQNEWLYWQNHGWDEEIRKEYSDWIWSDGSHPSIVIWDAINENTDSYIGNILIPELKKIDPTRIWDAGYMVEGIMENDEMDEPHPYQGRVDAKMADKENLLYPLGNLNYVPDILKKVHEAKVPQLVNEYGWIWLWRNGQPAKLTVNEYKYYLGKSSSPEQNRNFQAYYLQLETEWLRSDRDLAGVLAFCYLTNNFGYTGDWFIDEIKDLKPGPVLGWFAHCFSPAAVFINLTDERYVRGTEPHKPGSAMDLKLKGINDQNRNVSGKVILKLYDYSGKCLSEHSVNVNLEAYDRSDISTSIKLPVKEGGYLLVAEFTPEKSNRPVISRRYIKVGSPGEYKFCDMNYNQPYVSVR